MSCPNQSVYFNIFNNVRLIKQLIATVNFCIFSSIRTFRIHNLLFTKYYKRGKVMENKMGGSNSLGAVILIRKYEVRRSRWPNGFRPGI
jgi:hypothetical protein